MLARLRRALLNKSSTVDGVSADTFAATGPVTQSPMAPSVPPTAPARSRPATTLNETRTVLGTTVLISVAALVAIAAGTTLVIGLGELATR